jgi:hypothetical protein
MKTDDYSESCICEHAHRRIDSHDRYRRIDSRDRENYVQWISHINIHTLMHTQCRAIIKKGCVQQVLQLSFGNYTILCGPDEDEDPKAKDESLVNLPHLQEMFRIFGALCVYVRVCICACMYLYVYVYTSKSRTADQFVASTRDVQSTFVRSLCVCVCFCESMRVFACVCVCTYIYIYTYIHTYIHMNIMHLPGTRSKCIHMYICVYRDAYMPIYTSIHVRMTILQA